MDVFHVFWIRKVLTEFAGFVVGEIGVGWRPNRFGRIRGYEGSRDSTWQSTSFFISKWSLIEKEKKKEGHSNCPFHLVFFHQSWWLIIIVLFVILFSEIMGLWANIKFSSKVMWTVWCWPWNPVWQFGNLVSRMRGKKLLLPCVICVEKELNFGTLLYILNIGKEILH